MSISAISTNPAITSASQVERKQASLWSQGTSSTGAPAQDTFTSDFASILASVQSGDITSAQAALTKLTSDQPPADTSYSPWSTSGASSSTASASSSTGSTPSSDVQSLLQAVQSGDIGAAQQALSSLQTDMANQAPSTDAGSSTGAATQKPHHHHHHHAQASTSSTTSSTTDPTSTDPTSTDASATDAFGVSA